MSFRVLLERETGDPPTEREPGTPRALRTAAILTRMGDVEGAVERLEHAYREQDPGLVYLRASPEWEEVREDARVIAIMERMRLPR